MNAADHRFPVAATPAHRPSIVASAARPAAPTLVRTPRDSRLFRGWGVTL